MKLTKNTVIRATALILFFSMILAIILYDGGAYDFSFINRPVIYTTAPDTTDNANPPDQTTGGNDTTITLPPISDDDIQDILSNIKSLEEMMSKGYSLSFDKFGSSSALSKTDAPYLEGEFSLTTHHVTKKVFKEIANGTIEAKKETKIKDLPRIRLYFGYAIINHENLNAIYNKNGEKISDYIPITLVYQKTYDGAPVIQSEGKFYKIENSGITEISESEIKYLPISIDAPRYYANSNIDLYPYVETVMILTQVGVVTTEPPETTPDTTDPDGTTEAETTDPSGTTTDSTETTPNETTSADETTDAAPLSAREITDTTENQSSSAEATTPDETTSADETTTPDGTTDPEATTTPDGTTEGETTAPDDTEPDTELKEGDVIEKDGKLYEVSYRDLYGYKNGKGEVKIEPQYAMAYDFTSDGIACVIFDRYKLLFIDTSGKQVVSLLDSPYVSPSDFNYKKHYQTFFSGVNNDIYDLGMYYSQDGYVMVRYSLLDAKTATKLVKTVNLLYDKKGNKVSVPGDYILENYSDGIMLVSKNGVYGYLNTDSSWVASPVFDEARPFFQGLAVAHYDGKYGMIDTEGNTVLPFIFEHISDVSDGRVVAYSEELGWQLYTVVSK